MAAIAYRLRQRITIEAPGRTQDPNTGEMLQGWAPFAENVPASIEPLSVREFLSAQAGQSEISARIVIRYRPGIDSTMRVRHRDRIYNIEGPPLPDPRSGLEYLTLAVSAGVNDG